MSSVNKVILLGHCGRDPEVRYLPSGQAVANVSLATTSRRKNAQGETVEDTQWHRITFYEKLAEIASEYVTKGKQIYVEGRIKYGKYTDKDGIERHSTDIIATQLQLLGSREQGGQPEGAPARQQPASRHAPAPARAPAPAPTGSGFDDMDDDIPW
jgi:single-strand DNA-binding protein